MKCCQLCHQYLPEALYGELDSKELAAFELLCKECPTCAAEFKEAKQLLALMDDRHRPEFPEQYWTDFRRGIQQKLNATQEKAGAKSYQRWQEFLTTLFPVSNPMPRAAFVIVLLCIGFFSGRAFPETEVLLVPNDSSRIHASDALVSHVHESALKEQVRSYLERSSLLMLLYGFDESDHELITKCGIDLQQQQEMSHDLLAESRFLKGKLQPSNEHHLVDLIAEIENYLLQVREAQNMGDLASVEPLQTGMQELFCQVKCNLDEVRR